MKVRIFFNVPGLKLIKVETILNKDEMVKNIIEQSRKNIEKIFNAPCDLFDYETY